MQSVESVVSKKSVVWEIVKENFRGIEECEPEFSLQRPERGWKNYGRNRSVYAKQNHCVFEAKVVCILWWGSVAPPELSPDSGLYLIHSGALIFGQLGSWLWS